MYAYLSEMQNNSDIMRHFKKHFKKCHLSVSVHSCKE